MKPHLSILIPAKNASAYIEETLNGLSPLLVEPVEVIIVDDGSTDDTLTKVMRTQRDSANVRVIPNEGVGKIAALNTAFAHSSGDFVKCVDADDVLDAHFFDVIKGGSADAYCHDAAVVDHNLSRIARYTINPRVIVAPYIDVLSGLRSTPRWAWTFTRDLGLKIFPMPEGLPFEDVWFSVLIRRHARFIIYERRIRYEYRQHPGQTYGGILNHSREILQFRANRMLNLLAVMTREKDRIVPPELQNCPLLADIREYYQNYLAGDTMAVENWDLKIRLYLDRFVPKSQGLLKRTKWRVDSLLWFHASLVNDAVVRNGNVYRVRCT